MCLVRPKSRSLSFDRLDSAVSQSQGGALRLQGELPANHLARRAKHWASRAPYSWSMISGSFMLFGRIGFGTSRPSGAFLRRDGTL